MLVVQETRRDFVCLKFSNQARNKHTNEIFAIKEIKVDSKSQKDHWKDIKREICVLKRLNHVNCISFKGYYLKGNNPMVNYYDCIPSVGNDDILDCDGLLLGLSVRYH